MNNTHPAGNDRQKTGVMYPHQAKDATDDQLLAALLTPYEYYFRDDDRLFVTHAHVPFVDATRDSGPLDAVNQRAAKERFEEAELIVEEVRDRHFACGYIDRLLVQVADDDGKPITAALDVIRDIAKDLDSYPVLDEEAYVQAQAEEFNDAIATGFLADVILDAWEEVTGERPDDPVKAWDEIYRAYNGDLNDTDGNPYLNEEELREAIRDVKGVSA